MQVEVQIDYFNHDILTPNHTICQSQDGRIKVIFNTANGQEIIILVDNFPAYSHPKLPDKKFNTKVMIDGKPRFVTLNPTA